MANLIPENEQVMMHKERIRRTVIVALVLGSIFAVIGSVLLIPTYFLASNKIQGFKEQTSTLQKLIALHPNTDIVGIQTTNTAIQNLQTIQQTPSVLGRVSPLLRARSAGVRIQTIAYTEQGGASVTLSGIAGTRDGLIQFRDALRRVGGVREVVLPINSLTADTEVPFSITIRFTVPTT